MQKKFLSCDWGTSSFRLRLADAMSASVLIETSNEKGVAAINNEWMQSQKKSRELFFKDFLFSQIEKISQTGLSYIPIVISGMASSSIGMKEISYGKTPFDITDDKLPVEHIPADENFQHDILLVSGLRTEKDVMRGEETMLLGCNTNDDEQLLIFPGTHSKHVIVKNKVLVDFKTYMTGEIFDLLATKSILSKSVIKNENDSNSFEAGIKDSMKSNLLNSIFPLRTNQLFKKLSEEENYHYLSGLLIGSELKQAAESHQNILLVSSGKLAMFYQRALNIMCPDRNVLYQDADNALIKGQCALAKQYLPS